MKNSERVLALKEGYYASVEERQRCMAQAWGTSVNTETGIAVVSVSGATYASFYGPGTYSLLRAQIEALLGEEEVTQIVLEVNSPGGDVNGLFECCEYLAKAKEQKPIHCHVTGMCCSAAYALAASCTDISATETSEIGSVGVYAHAYDWEEYEKRQGLLSRIFRSRNAQKKNESPFTEEGAKDIQDKIDFYEDCFYTVLSEGRNMDREKCVEDFGHGAVFLATEALERNMVDSIVAYDELISKLSSPDEVEEDEGDDMDIKDMTAEQKAELFRALVEDSPSLLAEAEGTARVAERKRLEGLSALRDGSEAVDKIVNAAVEDGRCAGDIALDVVKAMKDAPKPEPSAGKGAEQVLETLAESDQHVASPASASDDMGALEAVIARANKSRRD